MKVTVWALHSTGGTGMGTTLKQVLNPNATRLNLLEQTTADPVNTLNPWQVVTYRFAKS